MRTLDYVKLTDEIQIWIKEYVESAKADGIVVAISGGIDSAVIASLSVKAIGKERVVGLGLPCESIPQDLEDARLLIKSLGISFKVIDLTSTYNEFKNTINSIIESNQIALANIKARLRMVALYFTGQSLGKYLVAGTGNRAELAIGYFTKYGDGGVDFEPLGELYKGEVRQLAKILKVPDHIITKPPSPGLWPGQTDEGEIGLLYNTIDEILYRMDYNLNFEGLDDIKIQQVKKMMNGAQHKLRMPPMFKVGK